MKTVAFWNVAPCNWQIGCIILEEISAYIFRALKKE
jgi:hypothetical protein